MLNLAHSTVPRPKQCRYTNAQLSQKVRDLGISVVIDEVMPVAIADEEIRALWQLVYDTYIELEQKLLLD